MSCCRNRCGQNNRNKVAGMQMIALRGPGCISGTGRCEGAAGNCCRRCGALLEAAEDFCNQVFCDSRRCCYSISGSGGTCCGQVSGSREICCGQVLASGGGFQCGNLPGRGCRPRNCRPACLDLTTPTTVPR